MQRRARLWMGALALLLVIPAAPLQAKEEAQDDIQKAVAFARERVYPALVNIGVVARQFRQGRAERGLGAGSGVIVSPSGLVVTNFHVAGDATRITCRLTTGEKIDADIVCGDPLTDLCILQLRMEQRKDPNQAIPFANIGASEQLTVGDHVLAMGNPQSLSSSITLGIVSNNRRVFTSFSGSSIETLELGSGQATGIFNQWIQHDALILPGNSGGPLVNLEGEVIGINTRGGGGVGFAIPSKTVKFVLNQAVTFGKVRRGWVGLSPMPVEALGRDDGVLVSSVMPGGPAEKAGIQAGDVVLAINGEEVSVVGVEGVPLFLARMSNLPQNKTARFTYERAGEIHTAQVEVTPMQSMVGEESANPHWGVSVMPITEPMAFRRNFPNTDGVLITSMRPGSGPDNAKPKLVPGDVILRIGKDEVKTQEDFDRLTRKHRRSKALTVFFRRGQRDMVTVLDLTKKPRRRGSGELAKAWLGVNTQVLTTKVAEALELEGKKGFRVTRVLPGSPAQAGGVLAGDVITHLGDDALDASEMQDSEILRRKVEDMDIGIDVVLKVIREGKPVDVTVTLGETPSTSVDVRSAGDDVLEYKVRELTYMDRVSRDMDLETEGLIVSDVTRGGWASVAGLSTGDVILRIQDAEPKTIREFKKFVKALAEARPKRVQFFVRRGRSTAFVFIQPEWPDDE